MGRGVIIYNKVLDNGCGKMVQNPGRIYTPLQLHLAMYRNLPPNFNQTALTHVFAAYGDIIDNEFRSAVHIVHVLRSIK